MNKRVDYDLKDTGQGKYLVQVSFTFTELTELRRVLDVAIKQNRAIKDDKKQKDKHELYGYRTQTLSRTMGYLQEAHQVIKKATTARKNGRYKSKTQQPVSTSDNGEG